MLTFEITTDGDTLEIHADRQGLTALIEHLKRLLQIGEGHVHLMTPAWGGDELSEEEQGTGNTLMNHVRVVLWE